MLVCGYLLNNGKNNYVENKFYHLGLRYYWKTVVNMQKVSLFLRCIHPILNSVYITVHINIITHRLIILYLLDNMNS